MAFNFSFGFGKDNNKDFNKQHNHSTPPPPRHHGREHEMVANGDGVFGWIERRGMFYNGDIPGVNGILSSKMDDSFDECLNNLTENINESIAIKFSSFRQEVSYEEIAEKHPDAEIVFIPVRRR